MSASTFSKLPTGSSIKHAHDVLRQTEKRRREAALEEGKRDQAKLLSSAKRLYSIGSQSKGTSPSTVIVSAAEVMVRSARQDARRDFIRYDKITEEQCLVVRALLACESLDKAGIAKQVMTTVLNLPDDASSDRLYRAGARIVHPDKCRHPMADSAFKILSSLYKQP